MMDNTLFVIFLITLIFFFSSRRRHTRSKRDWSSDVCSSDLAPHGTARRPSDGTGPSGSRRRPADARGDPGLHAAPGGRRAGDDDAPDHQRDPLPYGQPGPARAPARGHGAAPGGDRGGSALPVAAAMDDADAAAGSRAARGEDPAG